MRQLHSGASKRTFLCTHLYAGVPHDAVVTTAGDAQRAIGGSCLAASSLIGGTWPVWRSIIWRKHLTSAHNLAATGSCSSCRYSWRQCPQRKSAEGVAANQLRRSNEACENGGIIAFGIIGEKRGENIGYRRQQRGRRPLLLAWLPAAAAAIGCLGLISGTMARRHRV